MDLWIFNDLLLSISGSIWRHGWLWELSPRMSQMALQNGEGSRRLPRVQRLRPGNCYLTYWTVVLKVGSLGPTIWDLRAFFSHFTLKSTNVIDSDFVYHIYETLYSKNWYDLNYKPSVSKLLHLFFWTFFQIRNALTVLTKILPHFPVIANLAGVIEKRIEKVNKIS